MKLRTEIEVDMLENPLEHTDPVITAGSCFAELLAGYLKRYRFNVLGNPFGVLYNPLSLVNSFKMIKKKKGFSRENLVEHEGEWHSFSHHSDFSHHDPAVVLEKINTISEKTVEFMKTSGTVIITYGTAFAYKLKSTGETVSNCHKLPPSRFERYRLTADEIRGSSESLISLFEEYNRNIQIIFTVSPVRHGNEGAVENQRSKSLLITAIHETVEKHGNVFYFPSYEIMMDDLRDYRFYKRDLVHPNEIAAEYIWEKFSGACLSRQCQRVVKDIEKLVSAMGHRPRNTESPAHHRFLQENLKYTEELSQKYPHIDFSRERKHFSGPAD